MCTHSITFCLGSSCHARGNAANVEYTEKFLAEHGLRDEVDVDLAGAFCMEGCAEGPNVLIDGVPHHHVDRGVMRDLLHTLFPDKEA